MRLLKLSGFAFLTLGLFLVVLYGYILYQAPGIVAGTSALTALCNLGISCLKMGCGFILIGGALCFIAVRKAKAASKALPVTEGE